MRGNQPTVQLWIQEVPSSSNSTLVFVRENPLWGSASMPLARWLPAEYEDGQREPKGWNRRRLYNGVPLPSVGYRNPYQAPIGRGG